MQEQSDEKLKKIDMGRLLQVISHKMLRHRDAAMQINDKDLTQMQKHVLNHILMETLCCDVYQKNIEEEFEIRKSTATGILQLMEKNGYIRRESAAHDARLKRIVPTPRAEALRGSLMENIKNTETMLMSGISKEDEEICRKVLYKMYSNLAEYNKDSDSEHMEADRKNE